MSRCFIPTPAVFSRFLANTVCAKCGKPFMKGEEIVNKNQNQLHTRTQQRARQKTHGSGSKQPFRWYHKNCFTDAKGVPIYE